MTDKSKIRFATPTGCRERKKLVGNIKGRESESGKHSERESYYIKPINIPPSRGYSLFSFRTKQFFLTIFISLSFHRLWSYAFYFLNVIITPYLTIFMFIFSLWGIILVRFLHTFFHYNVLVLLGLCRKMQREKIISQTH